MRTKSQNHRRTGFLAAGALAAALVGCSRTADSSTATSAVSVPATGRLHVLVTISTFLSFAQAVGGDRIDVASIVPVGASPEDYQSTPGDVERIHHADLVIQNGLGLESWLARTVDNAKNPNLHVITLSDGLPAKNGNPHLWMDPVLARAYVAKIRDALSAADPSGRVEFAKNASGYDAKLVVLERDIRSQIATIPPPARAMIVFHNAWQYYDDRFGLRTVGVIELSPGQEPNPRYVSDLITLAKVNHVRAVFAEPEYSPKLVQSLAQSAGITTVQDLYDDSIGQDPNVQNYDQMLRYDTKTIVAALRGTP